ncbi:MAG TPA: hypothetical protein DCK93_20325 [Blastocatellia bacterium]|jgi:hypothetical protein|nr:hypothetical protein [Blastocatellia bacterium]HAF25219.1 hypothetical protein [Blastocatellia bacterium]
MTKKDEVIQLLEACTEQERLEVFQYLRKTIPIHAIEAKLNTQAEVILEAIDRASDLTLRGIRGIIAEAAFLVEVLGKLEGWKDVTPPGDAAYDFLIEDSISRINIQVKMQRKESGEPKVRNGKYVVETQRTRGGKDKATGLPTRPYRFGEFDILAVSMHPSTNDWNTFMYTVGSWLRPRPSAPELIEVYQPIPQAVNEDWTNDLSTCIEWLRSGTKKTIAPF